MSSQDKVTGWWSADEIDFLARALHAGVDISDIAKHLGRNDKSVRNRINRVRYAKKKKRKKKRKMPGDQSICWDCQNAIGRCSWSFDLTPVAGWKIEEKNTVDGLRYIVKSCPEFLPDREGGSEYDDE